MEESNTLFSDLILTVNKKPGESELNSLNVSLSLNLVVLKASINANITLYDDGEITLTDASILSKLNECVATYGELSENDIHTYETFIAYHAPFDL